MDVKTLITLWNFFAFKSETLPSKLTSTRNKFHTIQH